MDRGVFCLIVCYALRHFGTTSRLRRTPPIHCVAGGELGLRVKIMNYALCIMHYELCIKFDIAAKNYYICGAKNCARCSVTLH